MEPADPAQLITDAADAAKDIATDTHLMETVANNLGLLAGLAFVFYLVAAVCAVREVLNSRSSQGSIAWLLSLFFIPYVTVPAYLIFGWRSFDDYARIRHKLGRDNRTERARALELTDEEETRSWPVLSKVAGLPFSAGNSCDLLINGEETFASIFKGIEDARHTLLVQFFTVEDDQVGNQLADRLIERATAGVRVYFLYDDIGSSNLTNSYLNRLQEAGVHVSGFNERHKYLRILGPMRLNYRNHRKVVVADFEHAWVGGHNVADAYLGRRRKYGPWRDTHVKVSGPAALACALSFAEDWKWANGGDISLAKITSIPKPGDEPVLTMPTGPADDLEECAIAFAEAAARARHRLWITTPYFVPSLDIQTALYAAALRGVDVRILLPEKADHKIVWLASHAHADDMLARGVKVFRYPIGFMHQKVVLVDNDLASVGTVNFDNRSFSINFEITLWFTHQRMLSKLEKMLQADFAKSVPVLPEALENRSFAFRVVARGAKLLSPVL